VKVASEPEALLPVLTNPAYHFKRIGLEAGPVSQWLFSALAEADIAKTYEVNFSSHAIDLRRAIASAVKLPCFNAFLLPTGAPGDFPPCIRHRPFDIAGDWQADFLRVRAPQRGLRCIGSLLCMGSVAFTLSRHRRRAARRMTQLDSQIHLTAPPLQLT
jgi:hypothetical protein